MNNDSIISNNTNTIELNVPYHSEKYWEEFYKDNNSLNYDWYFELNFLKSNYFDLNKINGESEILILGIGNSSIIEYFIKNKFKYVTCVDFSSYLIKNLKEKYENREECLEYDCINLSFNKNFV